MRPRLPLLLLLAALLAACLPSDQGDDLSTSTPTPWRRLNYGLTLVPTGIDPHLNASAELGIPLASVYDTLVAQDPDSGTFVPGLAERWEASDDGRTWTFHLRADVRFHDGSLFDAPAVCANFQRITLPDNRSQKAAGMLGPADNYLGCQAPDARTAVLSLRQPYAPVLDSLSQVYFGMASPAAFRQWGLADYQFHQVGTGPFIFVEYVPGDHLTLRRNPDYAWGPAFLANHGLARVDEIVFTFHADPATRALALETGTVDAIGEVLPQDAARLAQDERFQLRSVPIPGQPLQILLNTQRAPTDDLRVRQALRAAVDRAGLVQSVFGGYSPFGTGPLAAVTVGYAAETAVPQADPPEAAQLLAEAGYRDSDGDGVLDRDGARLRIDLVFGPFGLMPEAAQLVEANWRALGIEVNSQQAASFSALREAQAAGEYHAISLNFFGADPDLLRAWYTSDGFYNWSRISDPELDDLLRQGFLAQAPASRRPLYARAQQRINDLALVIPLRDYVNLNVASRRVGDLRFDAQGWWPLLADVTLAP